MIISPYKKTHIELITLPVTASLAIAGLVLIALCGYYYYKAPDEFPGNVREAVSRVGDHGEGMIDAGKNMIEKGKDLVDKLGE